MHYINPAISIISVISDGILSASAIQEDGNEAITCKISDYMYIPSTEKVLVCHKSFWLMKNGGEKVGSFAGKEYYKTTEWSSQEFICCVTEKRLLLIPKVAKDKIKPVVNLVLRLGGQNFIQRSILEHIALQNYVDCPFEFSFEDIDRITLSEGYPSFDKPIIDMTFKGKHFYFQCRDGFDKVLDVTGAVQNPKIFM